MRIKFLVLLLLVLPFLFLNKSVSAEKPVVKKAQSADIIEAKKLDNKAKILSEYLKRFDSPMQYHAQDFIDASETYNLDWKMLPAIAGVESTFGKQIPGGFNAYGWGVYGDQALYFSSWRDGMFEVAKGLRENYINKGLDDPYEINRIYAASPYWGGRVTYFMQDLEKFAQTYESNKVNFEITYPKIAAVSGQPSMR